MCPERTYQDRAGQTECRPCPNRPSVTVKSSEHYNSRCRPSRPDHASIVALTKLPNRKSSSSTIQTRQLSSSASGKLGKIAAAHSTQTSPNHNDKFTSSSKYKNRRHHQHPVSQQPYQLATGRSAVSRNSFTSPAINDTAGIVDDDEDPCSPNPCLAGGTCFRSTRYADNNRIVSSFKCSCRVGTKGITWSLLFRSIEVDHGYNLLTIVVVTIREMKEITFSHWYDLKKVFTARRRTVPHCIVSTAERVTSTDKSKAI